MQQYWGPLKILEGEAAEQLGDFDRAREAYGSVLYLRHSPESSARAETEEIRRRLEALSRERSAG